MVHYNILATANHFNANKLTPPFYLKSTLIVPPSPKPMNISCGLLRLSDKNFVSIYSLPIPPKVQRISSSMIRTPYYLVDSTNYATLFGLPL